MNVEFNFRFNELQVDVDQIAALLGYRDLPLPAPFDDYLETALNDARTVSDICFTYRILDDVSIDHQKNKLLVNHIEFNVGKTICEELRGAEQLAFFICTAGKTISDKASCLLKGEDPVLGYVYDVLGSEMAEAAGDKMQFLLQQRMKKQGFMITNRFSPGYCHWPVADQHQLFSLFQSSTCGVSLTPSALMHPIKSISGVIGIGPEVTYRDYQCTLCTSEKCIYRNKMLHN